MIFCFFRLQSYRSTDMRYGFYILFSRPIEVAEVIMRARIVRLQPERF